MIFVCRQDSASVRGHLSKRDDVGNDDQVSLYLDTFRDQQRAYVFTANPLGVQSDGILTEGQQSPDYTFDTLWYSEGRLTPDGYVVWMTASRSRAMSGSAKRASGAVLEHCATTQHSEK